MTDLSMNNLDATDTEVTGLRLEGTTLLQSFNLKDGSLRPYQTDETFTLDLDRSGKWLLNTVSSTFADGTYATGFDGTNLYSVMYISRMLKDSKSKELTEAVPYEKGHHRVNISIGDYPFDVHSTVRFPWFALLSGDYLAKNKSSWIAAPWLEGRNDVMAYAYRVQFEREPDWPHALISAEFFSASEALPKQGTELTLIPELVDHGRRTEQYEVASGVPSGKLSARFSVQQHMEVAGARIPTEYTLEVFGPGVGFDTANLAKRFTGKITNVQAIEGVKGPPEPLGTMIVHDRRFRSRDEGSSKEFLRYNITDQKWMTTEEALLQHLYHGSTGYKYHYRSKP